MSCGIGYVKINRDVTACPTSFLNGNRRSTSSEAATASGEQSQVGPQQPQQQQAQQNGPQRFAVRGFQIEFQFDPLLLIKLAAVIFIFNQDGSRHRLAVLVFFAFIIYL